MSIELLPVEKSEILFLYESTYSIPNGDPFTGEQRYDEETKKILVSDVRIKRFIRDYFIDTGTDVYVRNDRSAVKEKAAGKKEKDSAESKATKTETADSGSAARLDALANMPGNAGKNALQLLTDMIDVRLFGGISTKKGEAINLAGPVQFALLNPSLNAVDLRMHQNTSVFASSTDNTRGAIGTTTVVPYSLNQIHGWVNPFAARHTKLTEGDLQMMFVALWDSINNANTRSKSNQNSLLLLKVVYADPTRKLYGLDRTISIDTKEDRRGEQLRNSDDYTLNFSALGALTAGSPAVKAVHYFTEDAALATKLSSYKGFTAMKLHESR